MSFVNFFNADEDELTLDDIEHRHPWAAFEWDELAQEDLNRAPRTAPRGTAFSDTRGAAPTPRGPDPSPGPRGDTFNPEIM